MNLIKSSLSLRTTISTPVLRHLSPNALSTSIRSLPLRHLTNFNFNSSIGKGSGSGSGSGSCTNSKSGLCTLPSSIFSRDSNAMSNTHTQFSVPILNHVRFESTNCSTREPLPQPDATTLLESLSKPQLGITDACANRINAIINSPANQGRDQPNQMLKIGCMGGGCSGLVYKFELVTEPDVDDIVFEHLGAKIAIDRPSLPLLNGSTINFVEGVNKSAFQISNPNSAGMCSCGESFKPG